MATRAKEREQWSRPIGSKATVYDVITERILAELEAGEIPWRKPWSAPNTAPRNVCSGKRYRGINWMLLTAMPGGCPWWITYRQAEELGGHIRKGEHGMPVIFWKRYDRMTNDADTGEETVEERYVLRYYTVFNLTQCDGIEMPPEENLPETWDPIQEAEKIVHRYCTELGGPQVVRGNQQNRAYYLPDRDVVSLPAGQHFEHHEEYYGTLFHELGHSTGHESRLNRFRKDAAAAAFGSDDYSKEELIAEMTAAFLCGETGIEHATLENSAAYIRGWLSRLDGDRRLVVFAAAQAQKAADLITGINHDEEN